MNEDKSIDGILLRIEKLERAVFGQRKSAAPKRDGFAGATGGLRFLIAQGFFDRKRNFSGIEAELHKHNYYYSKQAIQTPLNNLSKGGGALVGFKEMGKMKITAMI